MKMNVYNLASQPCVNTKRSHLRVFTAIVSGLLMLGLGGWRLDKFLIQQESLRDEAALLRSRQEIATDKLALADKVIAAQQKIWKDRIDWANGLVDTTTPVLSRHFDRLEALLPERVKLEAFSFDRSSQKVLTVSVIAASTDGLFELYRRLAMYELKISGETFAKDGAVKATLTVNFPNNEVQK